jgi:Fibronectin type III domain
MRSDRSRILNGDSKRECSRIASDAAASEAAVLLSIKAQGATAKAVHLNTRRVQLAADESSPPKMLDNGNGACTSMISVSTPSSRAERASESLDTARLSVRCEAGRLAQWNRHHRPQRSRVRRRTRFSDVSGPGSLLPEHLTDFRQFERLCSDLMNGGGYGNILGAAVPSLGRAVPMEARMRSFTAADCCAIRALQALRRLAQTRVLGAFMLLLAHSPGVSAEEPGPRITRHASTTSTITIWWQPPVRPSDYFIVAFPEKGHEHVQHDVDGELDGPSGTVGPHVIHDLRPGRTYMISVKTCYRVRILFFPVGPSYCSDWSTPLEVDTKPLPLTVPAITTEAVGERQIRLRWNITDDQRIIRIVVHRDGVAVGGVGRFSRSGQDGVFVVNTPSSFDDVHARPNTPHRYHVCFTNEAGTVCSDPFTTMAKPVAPTAPLGLMLRRSQSTAGRLGTGNIQGAVRIAGDLVTLSWQHAAAAQFIPGRFITIERLDRTVADSTGAIREGWIELDRISALSDPTRHDVTVRREPGVRAGTSYRVCAVATGMGTGGTVCSEPASLR